MDTERPIDRRSSKGSPKIAERAADPGGAPLQTRNGLPDQLRNPSLVIEDYYCVSVETAEAQAATVSLLVDALDGDSQKEAGISCPSSGQDSSVLSESEGPAQWLAAPKDGLGRGDSLSLESADDTSESESE